MGLLLNQMEKIASCAEEAMMEKLAFDPQSGVVGAVGLGSAGYMASQLPQQLRTLRNNALQPMQAARVGLTHTRGSDARRFLAQEKSMLHNAQKAMNAGDTAKATRLAKQFNSPMHRAWRGFKSMRLPGKFKLLAPILGTAAGVAGLGAVGMHQAGKAFNG